MSQYPVLTLLERHGDWIAAVVAATPLVAAAAGALAGASPWWLVAGLLGSGVTYLLARSYVELIRLMTDMLLPK